MPCTNVLYLLSSRCDKGDYTGERLIINSTWGWFTHGKLHMGKGSEDAVSFPESR
jgi:hypothetical protein